MDKVIYIILGVLIVGGFIYYLASRKNLSSDKQQVSVDEKDNPYNDLRNMAFGATAEQLQIKFSDDKKELYGVVMDWNIGEGIVTLVSFVTGDTSLYLSSGGGFIGGGEKENIAKVAKSFIEKSKGYLNRASLTEATPLPDKNGLIFYFLTSKGKFKATEKMQNIQSAKSEWLDLFEEANKLITEIRIEY